MSCCSVPDQYGYRQRPVLCCCHNLMSCLSTLFVCCLTVPLAQNQSGAFPSSPVDPCNAASYLVAWLVVAPVSCNLSSPLPSQVRRLLLEHLQRGASGWQEVARLVDDWYDWLAASPQLVGACLGALCRINPAGLRSRSGPKRVQEQQKNQHNQQQQNRQQQQQQPPGQHQRQAMALQQQGVGGGSGVSMSLSSWDEANEAGYEGVDVLSGSMDSVEEGDMPVAVSEQVALVRRLLVLARRQLAGMKPKVRWGEERV